MQFQQRSQGLAAPLQGTKAQSGSAEFHSCSLEADPENDTAPMVQGVQCRPRTFVQPCNWQEHPQLLQQPALQPRCTSSI